MLRSKKLALVFATLLGFATIAAADSIDVTVVGVSSSNDVIDAATSTAAATALNTWAGGSSIILLEDFEGHALCGGTGHAICTQTISTGAGDFTAQGSVGNANNASNHTLTPSILDGATSQFNGRYDVTPGSINADGHWLDSNDVTSIFWEVSGGLTSIFFFMNDVNDQGGNLTIILTNGDTFSTPLAGLSSLGSGTLLFVGIKAPSGISTIEFSNNLNSDGWGIDYIGTTAPVPEPGSLFLLGTGLLAGGRRLSKMIKK
jgi:hypothetical protein